MQLPDDLDWRQRSWHIQYVGTHFRRSDETRHVLYKVRSVCEAQIKVFTRYKFHQKVQQEGESFQQFLTNLKLLVKYCGYANPDEMVRDRVVIGCHATKTRDRLIQEGSDLALEKAIDIATTGEMSKAQLKTMTTENSGINSVNQKKQKSYRKTKSG